MRTIHKVCVSPHHRSHYELVEKLTNMEISPTIRQLMVAGSPQLAALSVGGSMAFPTILLQQLKANDTTIPIDLDTSSWIGSIYGLAGIPVILMPIIMQWRGRKFGYIITCIFIIFGWVLSLTATNVPSILASESFHGLGMNSLLPVSFLSMTEMLSPKYRFISMQIFGINITLGVAIAGIMGRFCHYKTVSSMMLVPVVIALGIAFFWPESPPWLACKGKFDKCEQAFVWLRGTEENSSKELKELVTAQKEGSQRNKRDIVTWNSFWTRIRQRDFYMPSIHIFILLNMMYWSGGEVIPIYFIEMVEKSTQSVNAAFYASIVMYLVLFLGSIVTNIAIRRYKNKSVLLVSTFGAIICSTGICLVTLLQSLGTLQKNSLICMYFLVGFMAFYSMGLNAMVFYIAAELMPVKHRSIGGALYVIFNCGLYASTLKISPYLFLYIGMWGTFIIYILNAITCAILVWRYIPETKGKTLQEIEDFYNNGHFSNRHTDNSLVISINTQALLSKN